MAMRIKIGWIFIGLGIISLVGSVGGIIGIFQQNLSPAKIYRLAKIFIFEHASIDITHFLMISQCYGWIGDLSIGILLIIIGTGIVEPKYALAKIHRVWQVVLIVMISMSLWSIAVHKMLWGVRISFFLFFILGFLIFQKKIYGNVFPEGKSRGMVFRNRVFYLLLILITCVILLNFALSALIANKFPFVIVQ